MSNKIIKWGFIGCGEVTKYKSGPAFQKVEGSKVVAVMSRDGKKAKAYAKERDIPKWYDDAQELIDDPEVNAVYIATPPSSHATYAIMSMKAGKPVYIEKPMAQTDLLQEMFGCILEASGYKSNRGGLYPAEDTLSACFQFDNGLVGSGSWCFVAHDSAREDRIEIIGDKGMICFSVFTYDPIALHTERGREEIVVENPEHVQQPLIQAVVDHLLGKSTCSCDGESATTTNWVMDKILGKI